MRAGRGVAWRGRGGDVEWDGAGRGGAGMLRCADVGWAERLGAYVCGWWDGVEVLGWVGAWGGVEAMGGGTQQWRLRGLVGRCVGMGRVGVAFDSAHCLRVCSHVAPSWRP